MYSTTWRIVLAMVALVSSTAAAADMQPVAVVSLRSYQNLIDDLEYFGSTSAFQPTDREKTGTDFVNKVVNRFVEKLLEIDDFNIRELPGVDFARPWGLAVMTDEVNIVPIGFAPITDLAALIEHLKQYIGEDNVQDAGDGMFEVSITETETVFVKTEGDWGYVGQSAENLAELPDPMAVLGSLPESYDLGVQVYMQRIPEFLRDMVVDMLRQSDGDLPIPGLSALPQLPGVEPGELVELALTQVDEMTLGWSLDAEAQNLGFEMSVKAVPDTVVAQHFAAMKETKTKFGSLLSGDDPLSGHLTMSLDEGQIETATALLESYQSQVMETLAGSEAVASDAERDALRDLAEQMLGLARQTIEAGQVDVAFRGMGNIGSLTLVAGVRVADADAADALARRFAELAAGDATFEKVQLDVAEYNGVKIHGCTLALPERDADGFSQGIAGQLQGLIGKNLTTYYAVANDAVYMAMGRNPLPELKAALDGTEAEVPPMELDIDTMPLVDLLGNTDSDQIKLVMSVVKMQLATADRNLSMRLETTDEGILFRGEAREGILKVAAVAFPILQQTLIDQIKSAVEGLAP